MNYDLQQCMLKLSQSDPSTLRRVRNLLDGREGQDVLLSKKAAAKLLGVSRATLWRMIKSNAIPTVDVFHGIRRIRMSDIEKIIASQSGRESGEHGNG
jgi:excisionase family DNA binding protein